MMTKRDAVDGLELVFHIICLWNRRELSAEEAMHKIASGIFRDDWLAVWNEYEYSRLSKKWLDIKKLVLRSHDC